MLKNYLKTAVRNLWKNKTFSFINITGLAMGMAVSFLILLYVYNEMSYDRFHTNSREIYRIALKVEAEGRTIDIASVPAPMGPKSVETYPQILNSARIKESGNKVVQFEDRLFEESRFLYADPSLIDVFTIPVVRGNPHTFLEAPLSLVMTEETASKYFGDEDPLGKVVKVDTKDFYEVTGIIDKMPENSHIKFDMLASLSTLDKPRGDLNTWMGFNYMTYLHIPGRSHVVGLTQKLQDMLMANIPDQVKQLNIKIKLELQPLAGIHLHSHTESELEPPGNPVFIRIFVTVAFFILIIACVNFMNLSTAQATRRAKEVGMRKVLGAQRHLLMSQFLGESLLLSFMSLLIAILIILALLPVFNQLISKELAFHPLQNWEVTLGFLGLTLAAGFISGAYPALFLSSFSPVEIFRSRFKAGKSHRSFRHGLVSMQYIISIVFICSTLIIYYQLNHVKNYNLGFDKERVVVISLRGKLSRKHEVFKNEIVRLPGVVKASACSNVPALGRQETFVTFEGLTEEGRQVLPFMEIDEDYLETLGMTLAAGRNFSKDFPSDRKSILLNETLVKQLGWNNPIGKKVSMTEMDEAERNFAEVSYTVIGVVKDFHFESLHQKIRGHLLIKTDSLYNVAVKIRPDTIPETLESIKRVWQKMESGYPFDYVFLDETFDRLYRTEQKLGEIFISFTMIAVFIASLGLFGLASFTVEQRKKEIGIRKVLGASVSNIVFLLSREFSKWVILANVVAWPVAYLAMNKWLQNFAYRISLHVWLFIASGLLALFIALLTISTKSIKAAVTNPVNSLRYE